MFQKIIFRKILVFFKLKLFYAIQYTIFSLFYNIYIDLYR